ncbi:kinase-like domain-containing protein [Mycena crocata]|nr:kinase-like domain-containing protein [Mycena crocata]
MWASSRLTPPLFPPSLLFLPPPPQLCLLQILFMPQSGTLSDLTGSVVDDGRLELLNVVGAGAHGKLYKAIHLSSRSLYAVKCLRRPAPRSKDAKFQDRERALHCRVSAHPNVVTLHRYFTDADHVFMVMDLCTGGDLYGAIMRGVYHRNTELIKRTFASIVDGVAFCHARGVYHRDLKPENILVGDNVLIADFGLSTPSMVSRDMDCGSGSYMTPESFSSASISYCPPESDVWALCIILVNLVTAMNPWHTAQASDGRYTAFVRDLDDPIGPSFLREILPISRPLAALLARCFSPDPAVRPTLADLRGAVSALPALYMSAADLERASPGVRKAAGYVVPVNVYDPSDYSGEDDASTSGSGYSSLNTHGPRILDIPAPAGLAPPRPARAPGCPTSPRTAAAAAAATASSSLVPSSSTPPRSLPPATSKVPFASSRANADASSAAESEGPLTPQAHVVDLPSVAGSVSLAHSSGDNVNIHVKGGGKLKRFMRRLRVWRKL